MKLTPTPLDKRYSHGEKRQYFPYILECNCPKCHVKVFHDFSVKYTNYPAWGEKIDVWLWCQDCEHEWAVKILPEISLSLVDNN